MIMINKRDVQRKISGGKGATIVFALVGLLLAAMISFVVVNTALGNMNTVHYSIEQKQDYHAVASAAKYIRDVLEKNEINYTVTVVEQESQVTSDAGLDIPEKPEGIVEQSVSVDAAESMDPFISALNEAIEQDIMNRNGDESATPIAEGILGEYIFSTTVKDKENSPLKDVRMKVHMDENYSLEIILSLPGEEVFQNMMKIEAKGHEWNKGSSYEDGAYIQQTDDAGSLAGYETREVTTETRYTVNWDNIVITKVKSGSAAS